MLQEVSKAWPAETLLVESRPFRGMKHMDWSSTGETAVTGGPADMYMVFLEHHWIVERWREALLWSWVVARGQHRAGNDPDAWTHSIAQNAWRELGGTAGRPMLEVRRGWRSTLDKADEWAGTQATTLLFCKSRPSTPKKRLLIMFVQRAWTDIHIQKTWASKAGYPKGMYARSTLSTVSTSTIRLAVRSSESRSKSPRCVAIAVSP